MTDLRLVFMGSPEFSLPVLEALIGAGHEIAAVYTAPPRPAGRGQKEKPSAVHAFAAARGLRVLTPESLASAEEQVAFQALFKAGGADGAAVVAYGLILPKAVIETPRPWHYGWVLLTLGLVPIAGAVALVPLAGLSDTITDSIVDSASLLIWVSVASSVLLMGVLYSFLHSKWSLPLDASKPGDRF